MAGPSTGWSGSRTRNTEPCPGELSTSTKPSMRSTMRRVMARPSPVPAPRAALSPPCSNSSKIAPRRSAGMPGPVSSTEKTISSPDPRSTPMQTPPVSVNLTALPARLNRICRRRSRSERTILGTSRATKDAISVPLSWARGARSSTTPWTVLSSSNGSQTRSIRPASIFEKSRISSMRDRKASAEPRSACT